MIKKFLIMNLIVIVMFTNCYSGYKKVYASALLPVLPEVGVAVEEAMAYLMASFGLTPAPDVEFNTPDFVKQWGAEQKDKFLGYCINLGISSAQAAEWITEVSEGTLNKGSEVWSAFKNWVTNLYPNSTEYIPSNDGYISGVPALNLSPVDWAITGTTRSSKIEYTLNNGDGVYAIFAVASSTETGGSNIMELYLYSDHSFEVKTGWMGYYSATTMGNKYVYDLQGISDCTYQQLVSSKVPVTSMKVEQIVGYVPTLKLYDNVGGIDDIYSRDGDLKNYDVIDKWGENTATDSAIPIDWQAIKDTDGTITKSLEAVQAKTIPIDDVMADTGVIGVDLVRGKVVDSDNDTTNDKDVAVTAPSTEMQDYKLKLVDLFPFCLPFDLIDFIKVLRTEPEAPNFTWKISYLTKDGMKQGDININLSPWNTVALIFRKMELFAFIIVLIIITRSRMIRG